MTTHAHVAQRNIGWLPRLDERTRESAALVVGGIAFVLAGVPALIVLWREMVPIAGPGSIGAYASTFAGAAALVAFALANLQSEFGGGGRAHRSRLWRRIVNLIALGLIHGFTALLLWAVVITLLQRAFEGAEIGSFAAAGLAGVAAAGSAYASYLSGAQMTTVRLASLVTIFLIAGVLTAAITATDPAWWTMNLSALGMTQSFSSAAFNITLMVAGLVVTALADYATTDLRERGEPPHNWRRARLLTAGIALMGLSLFGVGAIPVNVSEFWHNVSSITLLLTFLVLALTVRWLVPGLPTTFILASLVFVAISVFAFLLWVPIGYYNLTVVELVGVGLFFVWLAILIRNIAVTHSDRGPGRGGMGGPVTAGPRR